MSKRKELEKKVKKHIKDLQNRGIDVNKATGGKSVKTLSWNKNTYDKFMGNKKEVLKEQRDINKRTNKQGFLIESNSYKQVKKLQNEFNKKIDSEYNEFLKSNPNLTDVEKSFLRGKTVRHVNSSENIELQSSFRNVNLVDQLNKGVDIKYFIEMNKERMNEFSLYDVVGDRSVYFKKQFIEGWVKSLDLTEKQGKEILSMYKGMNIIEKTQFNKDLDRKMQQVESIVSRPRSKYDVYNALKEVALIQDVRSFVVS